MVTSGLRQPGQLLSLYRDGVSCPDSFQLLVAEAGSDFLTLIVPGQGLATPWIEAFGSTDLSFVPEGTPFTPEGASLLLTELVQGGEVQAQANGSTSSLQTVKLPRLYTARPPNQFTRPPAVDVTLPQLISPVDNEAILQNSSAIGCPPDPDKGFGYQIFLDWTNSSSPNGIDTYQLIVRNKRSRIPLLNIFVEGTEFTQTNCNSVVIDGNLTGWEWRVRALDNAGNFSDWTPVGLFRFAACQLSDGSTCLLASDLSVSKIASADFVEPETVLSYSVLVTNAGPSTATEVKLIDQLPFRVAFVSADSSQGSCSQSDGIVGCDWDLWRRDATAEIQIDVLIRPSAAGATLENLVLVEAAEDDPDDSNNLDQVATRVQAGSGVFSDLSLSKVDSADPLEPGASLIYTLTVRNDGPSTAPGVTLFDRLPQEVTLVSVQASQGACSESNGIVRCELGTLKTGGSAGVEISVLANSSDVTLLNEAFVESDRDDPDGSNNSASEETVVLGGAGLETNLVLTKSGSPQSRWNREVP